MPWTSLATKVRKDPLGPATLNTLVSQLRFVKAAAAGEHIISTGEHNAWPVPRVVRRVSGTTVSPSSTDITSVTHPATGKWVVNLASSRFQTDMRVQLNGAGDHTKPLLWSWKKVSATQLEVYCHQLSTALGAVGNAWAAYDSDFDIAIHSSPLDPGTWSAAHPTPWSRSDNLDDATGTWNGLVQAMADVQAMMVAEHTTAGEHNVIQVGRAAGLIVWDSAGTKYTALTSIPGTIYPGITSISRTSAGICVVTHDSYTTPTPAFVSVDYDRSSGGTYGYNKQHIANAVQTSATQTTVYIYRWDGSAWDRQDADFFLVVHGS